MRSSPLRPCLLALSFLGLGLYPGPGPGPGPGGGSAWAQAGDWQVTRSAFDQRIVDQLKATLSTRPDDTGTLRRLIGLYKSYRTLDQLDKELADKATKSGRAEDLVVSAHLARERNQNGPAAERYKEALRRVTPGRAPGFDVAGVHLHLATLSPPGAEHLQAALSAMSRKDARRKQTLRKAADLALAAGDLATCKRHYEDLLKDVPANSREEDELRGELAEALARGGQGEAAIAELTRLSGRKKGMQQAPLLMRIGQLQETLPKPDDPAAIASYRKALSVLPKGHHLRAEVYDALLQIHRRREELPLLLSTLTTEWPEAERGFLEWDILGRLYDETGDTDKAAGAYRSALSKNPHHIDARRRLIAVLERGGASPEVIITEFERLSHEAPGESRYYLELAERFNKAGQRQKALAVLAKAAARFSGDPSLHAALAEIYTRWGESELAFKEAELLLRIDPQDEGHIVNLGELYWARNRKDKAEEIWKRLLNLTPAQGQGKVFGMIRLAEVYLEHGLSSAAVDLYQKAQKAEPQNLQVRRGLALAYERLNRQREALPLWEQIYFTPLPSPVPGKPEDPQVVALRPLLTEARQHLSQLASRDVRSRIHAQIWQNKLSALTGKSQTLAPAVIERELLPLCFLMAEIHLKQNKLAEAETTLRGALGAARSVPQAYAEVLLQLVPIYRQLHKLPEAIAALKEAVQLLPARQRELYGSLAELSMASYRDDEALSYAERAVADAQGELRLGALLERKHDVQRAMAAYERAIKRDERLFQAHMALARLHLQRGELAQAAARYRDVARRAPQEELVLEAGRKAVDLHEYLGTLGDLVRDLLPLSLIYPPRPAYRKLLISLYDRYATPFLGLARRGDSKAKAELARLGTSGLKPLTEALVDGDITEQRIAVNLLGDLGNPGAAPALLALAAGPKIDPGKEPKVPKVVPSRTPQGGGLINPWGVRAGLGSSQGGLLSARTTAAQSEIDLRVAALLSAGRLVDPRSLPTFIRLFQHPEKQIRLGALYGMVLLSHKLSKSDKAVLEGGLRDGSSPDVQALSCIGIGEVYRTTGGAQASAEEALSPRLRAAMLGLVERGYRSEEGPSLPAEACAHALGRLGEAQAVPLLLQVLKEGGEELEAEAALALGRIGDRRALMPLLRTLLLKQGPSRASAKVALLRFGANRESVRLPEPSQGPFGLLTLDVRQFLSELSTQAAQATQAGTKAEVAPVLSTLSPKEEDELLEILGTGLRGHGDLAARLLYELAPTRGAKRLELALGPLALQEPELAERLLRNLFPALRSLLVSGSTSKQVRVAALYMVEQVLTHIPSLESTEEGGRVLAALAQLCVSEEALEVRREAVLTLGRVTPNKVEPVLEDLAKSPDRRVRLLSISAFGPSRLSRETVQRLRADTDGYVREAAKETAPR